MPPAPLTPADPNALASARYKLDAWPRGSPRSSRSLYFGIGHLHLHRSTELLRTRLDDAIPFWPWTSWCYLPFYAAIFIIAIAGFRTARCSTATARSVLLVMFVGALCHALHRRRVPAPRAHPPFAGLSETFMALGAERRPAGQRLPVAARRAHDDALAPAHPRSPACSGASRSSWRRCSRCRR